MYYFAFSLKVIGANLIPVRTNVPVPAYVSV